MKKIMYVLVVAILMLAGCSSDNSDEPKEPVKTEYAIGETAEINGIKVTVNAVRSVEGDTIIKPEEGTEWIAVEVTFENTTKESVYIGGIFELTMKDGEGREKDQNIWGDLNGKVDGDVLAGEKMTGEKSFVITGDEESLALYYKPSLTSKDIVKFIVK